MQGLERMNAATSEQLDELSMRFRQGLRNNADLFDRHAYRKHAPGQTDRGIINASLYDVMSTGLAKVPNSLVRERAEKFRAAFFELLKNEDFNIAITYGPNSPKRPPAL